MAACGRGGMGVLGNVGALLCGVVRVGVVGGTAVYGVVLAGLVAFQERLVYVPALPNMPRAYDATPHNAGLDFEDVWLTASDGVKLHAWLCGAKGNGGGPGTPTLLFFQENAGNIGHRVTNIAFIIRHLRCRVLILSYRGYGASEGSPTERGTRRDAQAALDWLRARPDVDQGRLVAFGRSLGGAVCASLVAANPGVFKAAILENTFTSIPDMGCALMPFLTPVLHRMSPLRGLVRHQYNNLAVMPQITTPTLLVCSCRDEMVPPDQMRALYKARNPQADVSWLELPKGRHMDAWYSERDTYWPSTRRFLAEHGVLDV